MSPFSTMVKRSGKDEKEPPDHWCTEKLRWTTPPPEEEDHDSDDDKPIDVLRKFCKKLKREHRLREVMRTTCAAIKKEERRSARGQRDTTAKRASHKEAKLQAEDEALKEDRTALVKERAQELREAIIVQDCARARCARELQARVQPKKPEPPFSRPIIMQVMVGKLVPIVHTIFDIDSSASSDSSWNTLRFSPGGS